MGRAISQYFGELTGRFGDGWNRFWFQPSDPFTLGLLRVLTGLVAIYVHLSYTPDLVRLFASDGMLPVDVMNLFRQSDELRLSYLDLFGTAGELWVVHALGLVILCLFTLGVFTRLTSVLAVVVMLSYFHRAPVMIGMMEPVLAVVMFYLCLGPCGVYLSIDRLLARRKLRAKTGDPLAELEPVPHAWAATISTRLLQVHISLIYLMMGLAKVSGPLGGDAWWGGDAVWWLMAKPESRLVDLTGLLYNRDYILNAWSHAIVLFELAFGVLIWVRLARPLLLALSVPLWASVALITGQVTFCTVMVIAGLAFVDPAVVRSWLTARSERAADAEPTPEAASA